MSSDKSELQVDIKYISKLYITCFQDSVVLFVSVYSSSTARGIGYLK